MIAYLNYTYYFCNYFEVSEKASDIFLKTIRSDLSNEGFFLNIYQKSYTVSLSVLTTVYKKFARELSVKGKDAKLFQDFYLPHQCSASKNDVLD